MVECHPRELAATREMARRYISETITRIQQRPGVVISLRGRGETIARPCFSGFVAVTCIPRKVGPFRDIDARYPRCHLFPTRRSPPLLPVGGDAYGIFQYFRSPVLGVSIHCLPDNSYTGFALALGCRAASTQLRVSMACLTPAGAPRENRLS